MKRIAPIAFLALPTLAGEIGIQWNRISPTNQISGYVVRYGPSPNNKIGWAAVGDTNQAWIVGVPDGIDVFTEVVAVGLDGRISDPSNQLVMKAGSKPQAPLNLRPITNVFTVTAVITNIVTFQTTPQ